MANHEDESGFKKRAGEIIALTKQYSQRTLRPEHTLFRSPPRELRSIDEMEVVVSVNSTRDKINDISPLQGESVSERNWREIRTVVEEFGLPETESYITTFLAYSRFQHLTEDKNFQMQFDPNAYAEQNPVFQDLCNSLFAENFPESNLIAAYRLGRRLGSVLHNRMENTANVLGDLNSTRKLAQTEELDFSILDNVMKERLKAGPPPTS